MRLLRLKRSAILVRASFLEMFNGCLHYFFSSIQATRWMISRGYWMVPISIGRLAGLVGVYLQGRMGGLFVYVP